MINFLEIIKNKRVLISIVAVALMVFFVFYLFSKNKGAGGSVAVPTRHGEAWSEILPGKSTKEDVVKKLGEPISTTENSLLYKSTSATRNNQITLNANQVELVKQMVTPQDKITTQTLIQKYGIGTNVLYGPDSPNGINLFVYVNRGFAYLGNPITESVIEIWYYPPTTLENFNNKYAQEYSSTYRPRF